MAATLAVVIFIGAYVLFATEWVHRTKVALAGAGLMLLLRITDPEQAFFDEATGIEWNVIFLLLGMMIIVSVLRRPASSSTSRSGAPSGPAAGPTG